MAISFDELAGTILTPTIAVETDLTSGRTGLPSLNKKLLCLGYATGSGSQADDVPKQVSSTKEAIALWGKGSHVAIMVEAALRVSPRLEVYGMSYAEGGAAVAASGTVTLATTATGAGTLAVHVAGRLFRVGVQSGDTPTVVGDALAAAINAHANLPATAANAAGVVTITARNAGTSGNSIRIRSEISSGIAMTSTDSGAALASGATEGNPATSALPAIENQRFHMIAFHSADSTNANAVATHQEARSVATEQKWGHAVCAITGTSSAADTLAGAIDSYRMNVVWHKSSDQPEFELAAAYAGERARVVDRNRTLNYHKLPGISAQYDESAWPKSLEIENRLAAGVVPIRPMRGGEIEIVRNVNSKQSPDAGLRDSEPFEISDFIDEDLIETVKARYPDSALKVSSPANTPRVVTPERILLVLHERMRLWDLELDYTQGSEKDIADGATVAEANATDPNRMDVGYPFRPVFGYHVGAFLKTYTTPDA